MKLKVRLLCIGIFLCGLLFQVAAQTNIVVTGKVRNKTTGEALVGASVINEKTHKSTVTNENGEFRISVEKGATLTVSFVGMTSTKYKVTESSEISIQLEEEIKKTEEVIVIGYGTQKRSKVSGAVSTVKGADIEKLKPVRTEEALQGTASGVTVIQTGSPGSKPTILIRGIASNSGNAPLVIIDGVQQTQDDLNSISPADIESISVLKDAAMTAIYGSKGGNGVIVVTTKGGRKNLKTEIALNSFYGNQSVIKKVGVLNATEYAAMVNEGSATSGGPIIFNNLSKIGVGTNWQDQVFKDATTQNHGITVRGGSDKMTYFLSGNYMSQGGVVGGDDKSFFNRGNFTSNLNFDLSSKLKFLVNTSAVMLSTKTVSENAFNSILGSALNFDPTVPVLNTTGTVGQYGYSTLLLSEVFNPLTKLANTYNQNKGTKFYGKFELQYDAIKNLKLTTRFGYQKYDDNSKSFDPLVFYGLNNVDNSMNADGSTVIGKHNSVANNKNSNFNWTYEAFANYIYKLKEDHHFEAVVGFSLAKTSGNAAGASRQDVPYNSWTFADNTAATGVNSATNSNAQTGYYYEYFNKNTSTFGRLNYDFKDRYLVSYNLRRDGSNLFGANNKFGTFSAISLGWVVSKESFFNSKLIDLLKVRGSSGTIGNDQSAAAYYTQIVTGGPSYGSTANSNGYNFNNIFYPGSTVGTLRNDNVSWESDKQTNIGFDLVLLKSKVSITFDYYKKNANGLLFVPSISGYEGTVPAPSANVGSTETKGIDLQITYNQPIGKNFSLNNTFTFTTQDNKVISTNDDGTAKMYGGSYFNGQSQTVTVFEKGKAPGYFYGYKTAGLFQNAAAVLAAPAQAGAQPGDIRFVDVNGDGKIDANDKTKIGNPFPKFIAGWNLSMNYKDFDFSAFFYASVGNDIYRAYERNANYTNKFRSVLGRWTGEGTTNEATNPRYSFTDANNNARVSDRYVEDGSFVKLKNVQLGYTFNGKTINKIFQKLRVYAQVKNAFTITKYTGFDPEISGGLMETGIDRGSYPQARTVAFGLDIKF